MKKSILLMLALVASTASFAQVAPTTPAAPAPETRLVMTTDQKIRLYVEPVAAKGQIAILDAEGHALYSKPVGLKKGLSQQFDVSGLGTGTYRVMLTTGAETVTRTFVVQTVPYQSFVVVQS